MPGSSLALDVQRTLEAGVHEGVLWAMLQSPSSQTRCGYVRLLKGHPWNSIVNTYDIPAIVHGHIDYREKGKTADGTYWIGFSCNNPGDASDPSLPVMTNSPQLDPFEDGGTIRTADYVRGEIFRLCRKVKEAMDE